MIASIILPALFVSSGLFALISLAAAWRTHGAEIRAIRRQLAGATDICEVNVRVALTETREYLPVARRNAIRPRQAPPPVRPTPQPSRRAAA